MKKIAIIFAFVFTMFFSITSCRDTEKKPDDVDVKIEKAADKTSTKTEGALERAGKAIDKAAQETKDAGKAIDSAAKDLTDDN
ncbi:MAG: hypothetical protein ABIO60_09430 [Aquaticitalea sp.]